MGNVKLKANLRTDMSKSRTKAIRNAGNATGAISGRGSESVAVEVDLKQLVQGLKESKGGRTSIIDMTVAGAPDDVSGTVILKDFQRDAIGKKILDVRFQRVSMTEKVSMTIPIALVGDSPGAKEGGIIETLADSVLIRCLPGNIPPQVEIDISGLGIGDHVRIADLASHEGVEVIGDPDTLLVTCVARHVGVAQEEEVVEEEAAPESE